MTIDQRRVPGRGTISGYIILFAALALIVFGKESGMIASDFAKRGVGILLALILAVTGNFLPQLLHPDRGNPAAIRRQRRAGWGLVVTGVALVVALIVAPDDKIALWTGIIGLGGLTIVFLDALLHFFPLSETARRGAELTTLERKHAATRISALFVVHAIGWAFAMFLADYLWGDAASRWMVIAFTIANSLLAIGFAPRFGRHARA